MQGAGHMKGDPTQAPFILALKDELVLSEGGTREGASQGQQESTDPDAHPLQISLVLLPSDSGHCGRNSGRS